MRNAARAKCSDLKAQASVELIAIAAAALLIGLLAVALVGNASGPQDLKISQSRSYWKGQTPIRIDDWSMLSEKPDAGNNTSLKLALLVTNPTQRGLVIRKILLEGMNITKVYSNGANYAGKAGDVLIWFAPSEQNKIVMIQESGRALPENYEVGLNFVFDDASMPSQTEGGNTPIIGKVEYAEKAKVLAVESGCDVGKIECGSGSSAKCCGANQICSLGSMCCPKDSVFCAGSCCNGTCAGGSCILPGSRLCGGISCPNAIPCCNNVCGGSCVDYVVEITANATALHDGETAILNTTTRNIGNDDAKSPSLTLVERSDGTSTFAFGNYWISALLAGQGISNTTLFSCTAALFGTHNFSAIADSTKAVPETSDANNSATLVITCSDATIRDLVIPSLTANTTYLTIGQNTTISLNTSNIGQAASGGYSYTSLLTSGNGSPLSATSFYIDNLQAPPSTDAFRINTSVFTCDASSLGAHTITARADSTNRINEDKSNNVNNSLVINCTAPDLVVSNLSANATSLLAGEKAQINATTRNIGTANSSASYTSLNTTGGNGLPLSVYSLPQIPTLTPNQQISRYADFNCNSSTTGKHTVWANADSAKMVAESNESNNVNNSITISCS